MRLAAADREARLSETSQELAHRARAEAQEIIELRQSLDDCTAQLQRLEEESQRNAISMASIRQEVSRPPSAEPSGPAKLPWISPQKIEPRSIEDPAATLQRMVAAVVPVPGSKHPSSMSML